MNEDFEDAIATSHVQDAYLGKHALQLMMRTSEQMQVVYGQRGLEFPIEASSTLHFLMLQDGSSLVEVAKGLDLQHQLVAQRVKKLIALGLVEKQPDPVDARRTALVLTANGRDQARALVACMEDTAVIYRDLFREIGCDLTAALGDALSAIRTKPLTERFAEKFAREDAR